MSHFLNPRLRPASNLHGFQHVEISQKHHSTLWDCKVLIITLLGIASVFSFAFTVVSYVHADFFPPAVYFGFGAATFILLSLLSIVSCWMCYRGKLPAVFGNRKYGHRNSDGEIGGRKLSHVGGVRGFRGNDTPTKIGVVVNLVVDWLRKIAGRCTFKTYDTVRNTELRRKLETEEEGRPFTRDRSYSWFKGQADPYQGKMFEADSGSPRASENHVQQPDRDNQSRQSSLTGLNPPQDQPHPQGRARSASYSELSSSSTPLHPGPPAARSVTPDPPSIRTQLWEDKQPCAVPNASAQFNSGDQRATVIAHHDVQTLTQPNHQHRVPSITSRPGQASLLKGTTAQFLLRGPVPPSRLGAPYATTKRKHGKELHVPGKPRQRLDQQVPHQEPGRDGLPQRQFNPQAADTRFPVKPVSQHPCGRP